MSRYLHRARTCLACLRPWRRLVAVTVGIALVGAVGTVTLTGIGHHDRARQLPPADKRVPPPGERLVPLVLLQAASHAGESSGMFKVPLFEVLPDGAVAEVFRGAPDDLVIGGLRPRADGRLVALGLRDTVPGTARANGLWAEGFQNPLLIVGANGKVESDQDVRLRGERVNLLGVTPSGAVLQRSVPDSPTAARIIVRDLSTSKERELGKTGRIASRGDIAGDRLVLVGGGINDDDVKATDNTTRCWVDRFAIGAKITKQSSIPACHQLIEVNASPDGRYAAVVYQRWADPEELRLRTIDLKHMRTLTDELLGNPLSCRKDCVTTNAGYLGMAWNDSKTLRVAFMDALPLGLEPDKVLDAIEDRLRTQIRTMTT